MVSNSNLKTILDERSYKLNRYNKNIEFNNRYNSLIAEHKNDSINKQLPFFEDYIKDFIEHNEFIKRYIHICAQDLYFNLQKPPQDQAAILQLFINPEWNQSNNEINELTLQEIIKAGGYYIFFKNNRNRISSLYPYGIPPIMNFTERFYDIIPDKYKQLTPEEMFPPFLLEVTNREDMPPDIKFLHKVLDKIEELESEVKKQKSEDKHSSFKKSNKDFNEDKFLVIISWDKSKKEFQRQKKLLQEKEISFYPLSIYGKPYFKRGDEVRAAASLFIYWQEKDYIRDFIKLSKNRKTYDIKKISEAFSMNENNEFKGGTLRDALYKVNKGRKGKWQVFADLLAI